MGLCSSGTEKNSTTTSVSSTTATTTTVTSVVAAVPVEEWVLQVTTTPSRSANELPSIFCFAMMMAKTYELKILQRAYRDGRSIFSCNQWHVFSDFPAVLGGKDEAIAVPGPPAKFNKIWLNTDVLFRAWNKIFELKTYKHHEWTVKVDPDAVFLPQRLRDHVRVHNGWISKKYFKNCPLYSSMQGPLEVLSMVAVTSLSTESWRCFSALNKSAMGEDQFLHHCMDILQAEAVFDGELLIDSYCGQQPKPCKSKLQSWQQNSPRPAAFHPFKDLESYSECLAEATEEKHDK